MYFLCTDEGLYLCYIMKLGRQQNWRILTNKEIYASVKKPTIIETIRLNRLRWFGHVQRMEENRIPKRVKKQSSPVTGLEWPRGFQEVKVPRFHENDTGWW